jgi:hypothetical protein
MDGREIGKTLGNSKRGSITDHSASVVSLAKRSLWRPYFFRVISVHIS